MNSKLSLVLVGVLVIAALATAVYFWKSGIPGVMPPAETPNEAGTKTNNEVNESPAAVRAQILGSWRSVDDARFTREFRGDGTVIDRYEGVDEATVEGHYEVGTDNDHLPAAVRAAAEGQMLLALEFPEEALFFIVPRLTAGELEMMYVGGSGVLRFERI